MASKVPDSERLKDVCEGYELLTAEELVSLVPEIAREGSIQRMIVSAVAAKRLRAMEEATESAAPVIPLRAGRSRTRR